MYSRGTDRRRVKLPPGYDGSAFRHDTGEVRPLPETDMKIHSGEELPPAAPPQREDVSPAPLPVPMPDVVHEKPTEKRAQKPADKPSEPGGTASFLEGLLAGLGSEEWLLFLVILLLLADGSDAWDVILLLCLLLAIRDDGALRQQ